MSSGCVNPSRHTACVLTPPALAGAVDCGRKKLPFAGYSVVKESVKLSALRLLEVRRRSFELRHDSLSPNSWAGVAHNRRPSYCAPGVTRPNLRLLHQRHRSASCFQPTPVRTSIRCYPYFILAMGRSPRFASNPSDCAPISDSLSLRLAFA